MICPFCQDRFPDKNNNYYWKCKCLRTLINSSNKVINYYQISNDKLKLVSNGQITINYTKIYSYPNYQPIFQLEYFIPIDKNTNLSTIIDRILQLKTFS